MIRKAIVAGYFYPDNTEQLSSFIEERSDSGEKINAMLALVPHAGYIYSGGVAVKTISRAVFSDTVIILGVNHTGFGEPLAVWDKDAWETPFGNVPVDEEMASSIINASFAVSDVIAHVREHAIEVVLPILKYFNPNIKIVPITVSGMSMSRLASFSSDLSKFVGKNGCSVIVSSDMNHYESEEVTRQKDNLAIEQILKIDGEALHDAVMDNGISMCGVYPASAGLMAVKKSGAAFAKLIAHDTSGSASNDYSKVVGYAGVIVG